MNKLSKEGKIIISAKEVASYVHCPESWNLLYRKKVIENQESQKDTEQIAAKEIWLADFDAARKFTWATNLIIFLIFFIIIIYLFTQIL